jgi:hypothetical protein
MAVQLIPDDEPPAAVEIAGSTFGIRRVPESVRNQIEAETRRDLRLGRGNNDDGAVAAYLLEVEARVLDYAIAWWRGLTGDPPCSKENKARLPGSVLAVVRVIIQSPARVEDDAKNSASPSGT